MGHPEPIGSGRGFVPARAGRWRSSKLNGIGKVWEQWDNSFLVRSTPFSWYFWYGLPNDHTKNDLIVYFWLIINIGLVFFNIGFGWVFNWTKLNMYNSIQLCSTRVTRNFWFTVFLVTICFVLFCLVLRSIEVRFVVFGIVYRKKKKKGEREEGRDQKTRLPGVPPITSTQLPIQTGVSAPTAVGGDGFGSLCGPLFV